MKNKKFDLEERTMKFAKDVRIITQKIPNSIHNFEYKKQVIRSSGSVGANYLEANEALGKKDFIMRLRISLKEARETRYWFNLLDLDGDNSLEKEMGRLIQECTEIIYILSAIIRNSL